MSLVSHSAWWIAIVLLGIAGAVTRIGDPVQGAPQTLSLPIIDSDVGDVTCSAIEAQEASYHDPGVHLSGSWRCRGHGSAPIEVYLGYLTRSAGDEKLRSPATNYPSGPGDAQGQRGWGYESKRKVKIVLDNDGQLKLPVTVLLLRHASGRRMAVTYWYHLYGTPLPDELQYRLALMLCKIMRQPSGTAIVRLASWVVDDDLDAALAAQRALATALYPRIKSALP